MSTHQAINALGGNASITLNQLPDECPSCHFKGVFSPLQVFYNPLTHDSSNVEVVFRCSNSECYEVFIGYYSETTGGSRLHHTAPFVHQEQEFSDTIKSVSSDFVTIYNQALEAENEGLGQICGPGYRKALEFLVKDYLVGKAMSVEEKEVIKSEQLGTAIANRIKDTSIKEVAKRAAWLGNDETHYVRKWEQKDLQDLKRLIDLTVHWMEAESLTDQLLKDMPENTGQNAVATEDTTQPQAI